MYIRIHTYIYTHIHVRHWYVYMYSQTYTQYYIYVYTHMVDTLEGVRACGVFSKETAHSCRCRKTCFQTRTSDTPLIDHLVLKLFVSAPPGYRSIHNLFNRLKAQHTGWAFIASTHIRCRNCVWKRANATFVTIFFFVPSCEVEPCSCTTRFASCLSWLVHVFVSLTRTAFITKICILACRALVQCIEQYECKDAVERIIAPRVPWWCHPRHHVWGVFPRNTQNLSLQRRVIITVCNNHTHCS